jgi:hypothetical protein
MNFLIEKLSNGPYSNENIVGDVSVCELTATKEGTLGLNVSKDVSVGI